MKKNMLVLFWGIIIIAGGILYYYFINNNAVFENKTIDFTKATDNFTDTLKIGYKKIPIEYKQTTDQIGNIKKLVINGKKVADEQFYCGGPATLTTLKDNMVVSYHTGCVVYNYSLVIYDAKGNEIKKLDILDNKGMRLTEIIKPYKVADNTITYYGNRIGEATGGLILSEDQTNFIDICDSKARSNKKVGDNELVNATYKIKYLGNNKYSTPEILTSTTVKEYVENNCK